MKRFGTEITPYESFGEWKRCHVLQVQTCASLATLSLQEPLRDFGTPDGERLIARHPPTYRRVLVHKVSVGEVLDHIPCGVPPIVEDPSKQILSVKR